MPSPPNAYGFTLLVVSKSYWAPPMTPNMLIERSRPPNCDPMFPPWCAKYASPRTATGQSERCHLPLPPRAIPMSYGLSPLAMPANSDQSGPVIVGEDGCCGAAAALCACVVG